VQREEYLQYLARMDVADIKLLMDNYGQDVWNYAFMLTGNVHMADDIAQETFVKAYKHFHSFRGEASTKTWLLRITRNTAYSHKRKAFVRKVVLVDFQEERAVPNPSPSNTEAPSAEAEVIGRETLDEIWQGVMELPTKYRDPLVLSLHYELSMEDIASLLGLPVGTVKSRISRAKRKLSAKWKGVELHG